MILTVWFNPNKGFFEVYNEDDVQISYLGKLGVNDNKEKFNFEEGYGKGPSVNIELSCRIVNERPRAQIKRLTKAEFEEIKKAHKIP